jgi:flagellar basal-body rod protein FlgF
VANGQYLALSAALAAKRQLDVVANNVANVNTTGFKQMRATFQSFMVEPGEDFANTKGFVALASTQNDHAQGGLTQTGNPLDVALRGTGFFAVQSEDGELLTRAGSFSMAPDGTLVDSQGRPVLSGNDEATAQRIVLGPDAGRVTINAQGDVSQGGTVIARLRVVDADLATLTPVGDSNFRAQAGTTRPAQVANGQTSVVAEHLEQSNVNAILGMTQLIELNRNYSVAHKIMQRYEKVDSKLLANA